MPATPAPAAQPDNRPVSVFTDQRTFVVAAFHELNRRLQPARLADQAINGTLLFTNQNVAGSNPQSVGELADLLERAVKEILHDNKLVWDVKPKALVGPNRPEKQMSAAESEKKFNQWQKDSETKAKYDKEQAAAEKRIHGLISNFAPARANRLDFALQTKVIAKHRGWLDDAKKNGKDLLRVEEDIHADQQAIYHKLERDSERM